jgi:transposase InsO family protein
MPSRRLLEELRAATLESRLEELGVLRSFSRPRVSNDNSYSKSPVSECPHLWTGTTTAAPPQRDQVCDAPSAPQR